MRTCHEAMDGVKPSALLSTLKERYNDATAWNQAKEHYSQILLPPRFAKADAQFQLAFNKGQEALSLFDQARSKEDYDLARQARKINEEAMELRDKGFAEIKAAGGE